VLVVLPILGGFSLGLAARRRLQRHFGLAFRANQALGIAVVALLAGWSFDSAPGGLAGLGVLLGAQVAAVLVGARAFRDREDGPLLAFGLYGNPGFWSVPVAAATLGTRAAVVVAAYDMLTQPRLAITLRLLRSRAPIAQAGHTALVDYAPMTMAVAGLLLGRVVPAPALVSHLVVVLATVLAVSGAVLLGAAWPRATFRVRADVALIGRAIALHLGFVPALLLAASLGGIAVPAGAWILALGPLPVSILSFARLYGYSTRLAAWALAASMALAVALLPLAVWLAQHGTARP
jgi:hypothetical protein